MAITYTGTGNLHIAAALDMMLFEIGHDKTDLTATCSYRGSVNGSGSSAAKVAKVLLADAMAPANTNETTAISDTDLTTDTATITVARQALKRTVTDLYVLTGGPGPNLEMLAQDMSNAASKRFTDMVTAQFGSLTGEVNVSGQAFTVDDAYDAMYTLIRARKGGQGHLVLAPLAYTQFVDSLRSTGQQLTPLDAASNLQNLGNGQGWGLHGTFSGAWVWSCDSVGTSGGDNVSAYYTSEAFGYKDGIPSEVVSSAAPGSAVSVAPNGANIFVEFERLAANAHTVIVGNYYVGVSIVDADAGVKLISSAT